MKGMLVTGLLILGGVSATADDGGVALAEAKGRTVRVWSPGRVDGTLTAFDDQSVTVRLPNGEARHFDRAAIDKMRVAGRGTGFYFGLGSAGAVAGAALGIFYAWAIKAQCYQPDPNSPHTACRNGLGGGTAAAAAVGGAAVGAFATIVPVRHHKGWGPDVDFRARPAVLVVPARRGIAVVASVRFQ